MKKIKQPEYFVLYKNFNTGKIEKYDIIEPLLNVVLSDKGQLIKSKFYTLDKDFKKIPISSKELLYKFVKMEFMYRYWGKCEWEYIAIDWPFNDTIEKSRPVKIDVYEQLCGNLNMIVDALWTYLEPKMNSYLKKWK